MKGLRAEIADLHEKAKAAQEKWHETSKQAANFEHVVKTLGVKREKREWLEANVKQLSKGLKERKESDEFLQSELDQFEERVGVHQQHKVQQTKQFEKLRLSIENARGKLRDLHVEAGKFEEQKTNHEQQLERRKVMVGDASRLHNIRGYSGDLNDLQIKDFVEKIKKLGRDQNVAVEKARLETEREMQKAQQILSKLGEQRSVLNENKTSSKQNISSNDVKIATCQTEIDKIEIDEGSKVVLEAKTNDLQSVLSKSKRDFQSAAWDKKIQESNSRLNVLEEEARQLNRDLIQGTKQASDLAHLNHLKKEIETRRLSLEQLRAVNDERVKTFLDPAWQPSTVEASFLKAMESKNRDLSKAEHNREQENRDLEQTDYRLNGVATDLKKFHQEVKSCEKKIRDDADCEPDQYLNNLAELQEGRDVLHTDAENFESRQAYFQQALDLARGQHKCKLCHRGFQTTKEEQSFFDRMEKMLTHQALDGIKSELKAQDVALKKAKAAGPSHDTWVRLSTIEIPRLEQEGKEHEGRKAKILEEMEHLDDLVDQRREARNDTESLKKAVDSIGKCQTDISSFSEQLAELTAKQKAVGLSRTLDEIQMELDGVNGKSHTLRNDMSKLRADKEGALGQMNTLELDLSKAKNELSLANHQLEKKAYLTKQIEGMRQSNHMHRDTVHQLEDKIRNLGPKISEEEAKRDDVKQRGLEKEAKLKVEASKLSDSLNKFENVEQGIQRYQEEGGPAKLDKSLRDIENAQQGIKTTEDEQKQVIVSINKISEELRNHEESKRTIEDNIKYRRSLQDLGQLRDEIANLTAQNAEADQAHWTKKANLLQAEFTRLSTEKTSKLGTARAKDDQLAKLIDDWKTDFQNAAEEYKMTHIEVEVRSCSPEQSSF